MSFGLFWPENVVHIRLIREYIRLYKIPYISIAEFHLKKAKRTYFLFSTSDVITAKTKLGSFKYYARDAFETGFMLAHLTSP